MTLNIISVDDDNPGKVNNTGLTVTGTTVESTKIYKGTDVNLTGDLVANNVSHDDITCTTLTASGTVSSTHVVASGNVTCVDVTSSGTAKCFDLDALGNAIVHGTIHTEDVVSTGDVACKNITATTSAAIGGDLHAEGDFDVQGTLNVVGNCVVVGETELKGGIGCGANSHPPISENLILDQSDLYHGITTISGAGVAVDILDGTIPGQEMWIVLETMGSNAPLNVVPYSFFDGQYIHMDTERQKCHLIWSSDNMWHVVYYQGTLEV